MRAMRFLKMLVNGLILVTVASMTGAADHINPARAKIIDSSNSSPLTEEAASLLASPLGKKAIHSSDWLAGTPIKDIPPCRKPFFQYLLGESGLEKSVEETVYERLARDRIANLTNRIVSAWHDQGMRRFRGKLSYLIVDTSSGAPIHFDFDYRRSQIEPWIREEEACRSKT